MSNARDTIGALLAPLRVDDFFRTYWGRRFLRQSGDANRFEGLLTWSDISRALVNHPWPTQRMRLQFDGAEVTADRTNVEAAMQQGTLLSLSAAEERFESIRRLVADVGYVFRERVQASVHGSYEYAQGSGVEWDGREVFILQVSGRKYWKVYSPTAHAPLFQGSQDNTPPDGDPVWHGEVQAGGMLYLPRGYWYSAEGVDSPSLHIAIGVECATGLDLIAWLERRLRASSAFRENLPRMATAANQRDHSRKLAVELRAMLDETLVERFLKDDDRQALLLAGFAGLSGASDETVLRWLAPRPVEIQVEERLGRFLEFACLGREWHLPRWTELVVRLLVERREVRRHDLYGELAAQMSRGDVDQALTLLLREGLIGEAQ